MNTFGTKYRITIFGESHSKQIGIVIDGCPCGVLLSEEDFTADLFRRKATEFGGTARKEPDKINILSGVFNNFTTGAPITILINNEDIDSSNYAKLKFRPGHADFTAYHKYHGYNDYRGGGMFSGRTTVALVVAGVIAKKIISKSNLPNIQINANIYSIGEIINKQKEGISIEIENLINEIARKNDSIGGIIECRIANMPIGIGEPYFNSIESMISHIAFSIPGIKGIEFGDGFGITKKNGSIANDTYLNQKGETKTNFCGGINGGISNGNDIIFRVAVRPTASIMQAQTSYNFDKHVVDSLNIAGRHDVCFALRMPVLIEAVAAIAIVELI